MTYSMQTDGQTIIYHIRPSTRARKVSLRLRPDGVVELVQPKHLNRLPHSDIIRRHAHLILRKQTALRRQPLVQFPPEAENYSEYKEAARLFVHRRLTELNQSYGFTYKRIAMKKSTTRWGSCSKRGNLNFHYKILFLPPELQDYLLVHELCHLRELNHSVRFWSLVAQVIDKPREKQKQLRHYRL